MSKYESLQKNFFNEIKNNLPDHISLVNQISETLDIGTDSAYRRIRGQKQLSLEELEKLAKTFDISIDALILNSKNTVTCHFEYNQNEEEQVEHHLLTFQKFLKDISRFNEKGIFFEAKDLPISNLLLVPELFAFKRFFWCKVLYNHENYKDKKYSKVMNDNFFKNYCKQTLAELVKIPSVEIWNTNTIDTLLNQVRYCMEKKYFENDEECQQLIQSLFHWQELLKEQCELGYRSVPGTKTKGRMDSFFLYCTEIIFPTNNILVKKNGYKAAYLVQHDLSMIVTEHQDFCNEMYDWLQSCKSNASVISRKNPYKFKQFFDQLNQKLTALSIEAGL